LVFFEKSLNLLNLSDRKRLPALRFARVLKRVNYFYTCDKIILKSKEIFVIQYLAVLIVF